MPPEPTCTGTLNPPLLPSENEIYLFKLRGRILIGKRRAVLRAKLSQRQLDFGFRRRPTPKPKQGGKRKNAGRKPKNGKAGVPHRTRPKHAARYPLHLTLRAARTTLRNAPV